MEQHHNGIGDNINIHGNAYFNAIQKHPTIIADVINALSNQIEITDEDDVPLDFTIQQKIDFNKVVIYRSLIQENAVYDGQLGRVYDEFEKQGSFKKNLFLKYIRNKYLSVRGKFENEKKGATVITVVQENADKIIETVLNEIYTDALRSDNLKSKLEEAKTVIEIIVVDAFMRCKILENPKE